MKNFEKLEVGAVYRDRDGALVEIVHVDGDPDPAGPFHGRHLTRALEGRLTFFRADGRINYNGDYHGAEILDLMEKVE